MQNKNLPCTTSQEIQIELDQMKAMYVIINSFKKLPNHRCLIKYLWRIQIITLNDNEIVENDSEIIEALKNIFSNITKKI